MRVDDLNAVVWRDVCELLRNSAKLHDEYERRLDDGEPKASFAEEQLDRQITELRSGLSRLIDSYQEGLLKKEEFDPRVRAARERLTHLDADATQLADEREKHLALRLRLQGVEDFAARVQAGLGSATWHEKREIIRALVRRVEVATDEIRIVYRVSSPPFVSAPSGALFNIVGVVL